MAHSPRYTLGIDFGTLSGRVLVLDADSGEELAVAVHPYANGVIETVLPGSSQPLPPDWALQDPVDYLAVLQFGVPAALRQSGIDPAQVVGIGIDFTSCTMLPTRRDGTPLCVLPSWHDHPHAWVKLWKHHAAQSQADRITAQAATRGEPWLARYGGTYSAEWFFSKALQILEEDPEVYAASERLIEAADWVVWQLTDQETRNRCTLGYKALYQEDAFPAPDFFAALDPRFRDVVTTRVAGPIVDLGACAGRLSARAAQWMGLREGIAVATANVDAHVTAAAVQAVTPGTYVLIMGTSTCNIVLGNQPTDVEGMCGVVRDGVIPGYWAYEAGQNGVGDVFAWYLEQALPPAIHEEARVRGHSLHEILTEQASLLAPGESGLMALDWWLGNRSTLVNTDLTGVLLGLTTATTPADIYRTLIEATAFGQRLIIETFEEAGVPIHTLVAAGGLAEKNALVRQIYADVLGKPLYLAGSPQAPALGSAIHAAVAAGLYPDIPSASRALGKRHAQPVLPDARHTMTYATLYQTYRHLYDTFGRTAPSLMATLKHLRHAVKEANHAAS